MLVRLRIQEVSTSGLIIRTTSETGCCEKQLGAADSVWLTKTGLRLSGAGCWWTYREWSLSECSWDEPRTHQSHTVGHKLVTSTAVSIRGLTCDIRDLYFCKYISVSVFYCSLSKFLFEVIHSQWHAEIGLCLGPDSFIWMYGWGLPLDLNVGLGSTPWFECMAGVNLWCGCQSLL